MIKQNETTMRLLGIVVFPLKKICLCTFFFLLFITPPYLRAEVIVQNFEVFGIEHPLFERLDINTNQPIEKIAGELLHALEQEGYFLAVVTVEGKNGLRVDFGNISKITVTGLKAKTERKARGYLLAAIKNKPHIDNFDRALALINDMPGVSASLAFDRDSEKGSYEVIVTGSEFWQLGALSLDSTPRNLFKQNRIILEQNFSSVLAGGDIFRFQGTYVDGDDRPEQYSVYGSYEQPVGNDGVFYEIDAGDLRSETSVHGSSVTVVTNTGFRILPGTVTNQDFDGQIASLTVGYPFKRNHTGGTYILSSVDYSCDETDTVGEVENWMANISFFRNYHSPTGYSLAAGLTMGGGHTKSYIDDDTGDFGLLRLGVGYIQPIVAISSHTEMRIEGYGQIGSDNTPDAKTLGLGSIDFLRGYDSSTFIGTSGAMGTIELAHAYDIFNAYLYRITPFVFADFGYISNPSNKENSTRRPNNESLISVGFGASIDFRYNVQLSGYFGTPLSKDQYGNVPSPRAYMKLSWGW